MRYIITYCNNGLLQNIRIRVESRLSHFIDGVQHILVYQRLLVWLTEQHSARARFCQNKVLLAKNKSLPIAFGDAMNR